ncbi:MAG: hypothetical protein CVV27_12020, partial [Candidatus Melainabacteria bacterium HGW-Melainabacteria-1]
MTKFQSILAASLLVGLTFTLSGCPDTPLLPGQETETNTGLTQDANGDPLDFTKLSEQEAANYSDIAVGPDGTLHALFTEQSKSLMRPQVYYRASRDGGQSWSETRNLLAEDPVSQAGFIRIAVDGEGRVYAFWKTYKGFDMVDPSGGNAGTLMLRVLENGSWSAASTLGTPGQVVSWFPATAPDGRLHLVWNETIQQLDGDYASDWEAGRIRQASLQGPSLEAVRDIHRAKAVQLGSSNVYYYDGYKGLSGYVDERGAAHFSALKMPAGEKGTPTSPIEVVHFDGNAERTVMPVAALEAVLKPITRTPPQLLRDAQGREHLLVLRQNADRPALLDIDPASPESPTTIYQLGSSKGDIRGFQVTQSRDGQLAALIGLHDTGKSDARHDLYVARLGNSGWGTALNLTDNVARADFVQTRTSGSTSFSQLTAYSAKYAA